MATTSYMTEGDGSSAIRDLCGKTRDDILGRDERTGDEDLSDLEAMSGRSKHPGFVPGRMLLGGDQDFISGSQGRAQGLKVKCFGSVSSQRQLARLDSENRGEAGDHLLSDPILKVMFSVEGFRGNGPVSRGDRIGNHAGGHAQTRVVHVRGPGLQDEERADISPRLVCRVCRRGW